MATVTMQQNLRHDPAQPAERCGKKLEDETGEDESVTLSEGSEGDTGGDDKEGEEEICGEALCAEQ